MMDRRRFVGAVAGGLVIAQSIAGAQSTARVYRIGFFLGASGESVASLFGALSEGLRDLGYVEGRNVVFERRYADGHMDRLPEIAAELVRLKVDVIVTGSSIHVAAARQATKTIPIVMVFTADPVQAGFVTSLARPGGNVTGLTADASRELWSKYLANLREIVPKLSRVGVLGQVKTQVEFTELDAASRKLDIALEVADMKSPADLDGAFSTMIGKLLAQGVDCGIGDQISAADDFQREPIRGSGTPDELRAETGGPLPPRRDLRRQDSSRNRARRPARRTAFAIRTDHQYEDRKGAGTGPPAVAADAGRRRDSVMDRVRSLTMFAVGVEFALDIDDARGIVRCRFAHVELASQLRRVPLRIDGHEQPRLLAEKLLRSSAVDVRCGRPMTPLRRASTPATPVPTPTRSESQAPTPEAALRPALPGT